MDYFYDKVIIITGASSGIGLATAKLFSSKGSKLVLAARSYDKLLQIQSEIRTQRALWMSVVAMNRAFGIGPKRFMEYAKELMEVAEWYQEMLDNVDEVYANEKLRREAQKCSGTEIEPLYDKEMQEAMERWNEANK